MLSAVRKDLEAMTPAVRKGESYQKYWSKGGNGFKHGNGALQPLARAYLGVPATSVPSERAWSSAGFIYNERRASMTPDNLAKRAQVRDRVMRLSNKEEAQKFVDSMQISVAEGELALRVALEAESARELEVLSEIEEVGVDE
jgi:hypothetical protein